jgi:hypothetical protein
VKNLAKLALFFSLSFAVLFLAGAGFRFLDLRVQWIRYLPQQPQTVLTVLIDAAHWSLSLALYGSLLLSLSYAARKHFFAPVTIGCLFVLSLVFSSGISAGLKHWAYVPPAQNSARPLGGPGLILRQANTSVVLLKGPEDPRGPRVTALPDRPLLFQAQPAGPNNSILSLPPIPLGNEEPWFLESIAIDIRLSAEQIEQRFSQSPALFLVYTGTLIFFLCSLGFILKFSVWPLANLFFGCLAFRGILALETFFNSPEMGDVFESFLRNRLPPSFFVPLIFCVFGLLVYLYSVLVYLARRRSNEED